MDKVVNAQMYASGCNYQLMGSEKQTLQIVLMPGQEFITKQQALLYASDNITSQTIRKNCCGRICEYLPTIRERTTDDKMNLLLRNDTSTVGYAGLQLMKGKIIVLDNKINVTKNMIVKNKYVIAQST